MALPLALSALSQKSVISTRTVPRNPSLSILNKSKSKPITLTTAPGERFEVTSPYLVFCSSLISSEIFTSRGQKTLSGLSPLVSAATEAIPSEASENAIATRQTVPACFCFTAID